MLPLDEWQNTSEIRNLTLNATVYDSWLIEQSVSNAELVLIVLFLVAWSVSIVRFCTRWNNVSLMQPVGTRYCYMPKNLETVRVVSNEEESIIYSK